MHQGIWPIIGRDNNEDSEYCVEGQLILSLIEGVEHGR
jgi:hypothetical protein